MEQRELPLFAGPFLEDYFHPHSRAVLYHGDVNDFLEMLCCEDGGGLET